MVHGIVDGQVQGVHLCAPVIIDVLIRVVTRSCVDLTVSHLPRIALARSYGVNLVLNLENPQIQRHDAVAAVGVRKDLLIMARLCVNRVVPDVCFARAFREFCDIYGINNQVQGVHVEAPVFVSVRVGVRAGFCVNCIVPYIEPAGGVKLDIVRAVVDGQMQCHEAVATIAVRECAGIISGSSERFVVPDIFIANCFCEFYKFCMINREMQGVHAGTTFRVFVIIRVRA